MQRRSFNPYMSVKHLVMRHYHHFKHTGGTFSAIQGMKRHIAKFL